jgi:ubiquinone/menaquinone biosynthesis C-methylase UbiE
LIAEIGAGSGVDAVEIASRGFAVVALDISLESLRVVKSRAKDEEARVMLVRGDALHLPFKRESLDFLYHQGVMEHFRDPLPFLFQQLMVLRKGGRLLVDVPQTFTVYTLKKKWAMARGRWFAGWETQYTPRRLRQVLKKVGLRIVDSYGRDYDFLPFVWLRDITTLGKTRFGRPIVPRPISKPVWKLWQIFERTAIANYLKHSIGAVAILNENRN